MCIQYKLAHIYKFKFSLQKIYINTDIIIN